jgi:negative regulator of flagellin synthesis FlgM
MRVVPGLPGTPPVATGTVSEAASAEAAPPASSASSGSQALQSAVLQPALAAMRDVEGIDHAKVALLRDALAKGELPFNVGKLAALIESYHRSGK